MPVLKQVKARKDYPEHGIKKGELYWNWKFNFDPVVRRSKTKPRRSQLTKSDFLQTVYDIEDDIGALTWNEVENGAVADIISRITELRDETEERKNKMPEQLQETSAPGQTLSSRMDSLDTWEQELEGVSTEVDDAAGEVADQQEAILDELKGCTYDGE